MRVFACYNTNESIRKNSSSGGIFSKLASSLLQEGGVVYGVAMSQDCYSAEFIRVTEECEMSRLRGSKYIQARVGDTYLCVKKDLLEGKTVLFSGTGCQINGLKAFLREEYQNLFCVDVICHGVPSSLLWEKYVRNQESKFGKIHTVSFRCKDVSWENFGMKENEVYIPASKDSYMKMFLRNYSLRPSCYSCVAKQYKCSDITIADFWGIDNVVPVLNDHKGTSLVLVRTDKGNELFDSVASEIKIREVSYEDAVRGNPTEYSSVQRPKERVFFYEDMNNLEFELLEKKYASEIRVSIISRIKRKIVAGFNRFIFK